MTTPKEAAGGPFKALLWTSKLSEVETQRYGDPVDALAACVAALQNGYQARLSDNAVAWFRQHEAVGGLKLSDMGGDRRAAPSQVAEVPAERLAAEQAAAEVPAERPAVPARRGRGRAAAQPPAEPATPPEAPAAPRRGARRARPPAEAEQVAEPEPEAPRRRGRPAAVPAANFRAPAMAGQP